MGVELGWSLSGSTGKLVKGRGYLLGIAPRGETLRINWLLIYKMAALLFYQIYLCDLY
jgi:hypothetical protein